MAEPRLRDPNRVLTVPNVLSVIRLVLVPVFLWLLLVEHADAWATGILMFTGASDWADGKIARLMNQSSRLGELLDPAVDRIYMITIPIAFAVRHFVPWWFVIVLVGRDAILAATLPALRSRGLTSLPVTYIGKGATFGLMSGFPLILLGQFDGLWSRVVLAIGWGFTIWGFALYLWSFVLYMAQFVLVLQRMPKVGDPAGRNVGGTSRPQGRGTTGDEQRD
jgi:cardiolipin synthase (CMP-forming)